MRPAAGMRPVAGCVTLGAREVAVSDRDKTRSTEREPAPPPPDDIVLLEDLAPRRDPAGGRKLVFGQDDAGTLRTRDP